MPICESPCERSIGFGRSIGYGEGSIGYGEGSIGYGERSIGYGERCIGFGERGSMFDVRARKVESKISLNDVTTYMYIPLKCAAAASACSGVCNTMVAVWGRPFCFLPNVTR